MHEVSLKENLKKIIILSVCITVLLFLIGCGIVYAFVKTMNRATEIRMQEEAMGYRQQIERQIDRKFDILTSMAGLIGTSRLDQKDSFRDAFLNATDENGFLYVGYFDMEGEGIYTLSDSDMLYDTSLEEMKPQLQDIVKKSYRGEQAVSDAFMGQLSKQKVFVFGVPVYYEDKVVGSLTATSRVDVFSKVLEKRQVFYGSGSVHLINMDGKFIISSDPSADSEKYFNILEAPYLREEAMNEVKNAMGKRENAKVSFYYDEEEYSALFEPMDVNGWYLLCINSSENVNRNLYRLVYTAIIFYVLVSGLFVFTLIYGYRMTKRIYRMFQKAAYYDKLTGLYNVKHFVELAEAELKKGRESSIVVLNVRQFKFINEFFKREQADKLLQYIARVLQEAIGEEEYTCRENADTFYLLLKENDKERLRERILEICDRISETNEIKATNYHVAMRCGIAGFYEDEEVHDVIVHAMFALEKTKKNQEENICFFNKELYEQEQLQNYVERHASAAIDNEEFRLYLQPKIDLEKNSLAGAEALVRWIKSDGSMIYPGDFIPVFEKNGFCANLDLYMFERVCRQLRTWIDAGYEPVPVSVNQSKLTFYKENYEEKLYSCLEKYQISASLIILEILEDLVIEDVEKMNLRLNRLRAKGFRISMDDFGSGYSSLNTLGRLKIDEVKLDRAFLKEAMEDREENTRIIVEEVVRMSKKLSISTVMEGVETKQDEQFVKRIGCDKAQGYLYSRPVSAEVFTSDILAKRSETEATEVVSEDLDKNVCTEGDRKIDFKVYTKKIWEIYFFGDRSQTVNLSDEFIEDAVVIGTGKHEFYESLEALSEAISAEIIERKNIHFEFKEFWCEEKEVSPEVTFVYGGLVIWWESEDKQVTIDMDTRFTVLYRKSEGRWKIAHVHQSLPNGDQADGEFYPKTLAEQLREEKEAAYTLAELAKRDPMTGLLNYREFEKVFSKEKRTGEWLFVADLDDFKKVNDNFGHMKGNEVLKNVANVLRTSVRRDDLVCRMGGDEFILLCRKIVDDKDVRELMQRLMSCLKEIDLMEKGWCGISIGGTKIRREDTLEEAFMRADQVLYSVKLEGKNHWKIIV